MGRSSKAKERKPVELDSWVNPRGRKQLGKGRIYRVVDKWAWVYWNTRELPLINHIDELEVWED